MEGAKGSPHKVLKMLFDLSKVNPAARTLKNPDNEVLSRIKFQMYCSHFWHSVEHPCKYWHKFIVLNGTSYNKEAILSRFVASVHPGKIIPILYHTEDKNTVFFAQNCTTAIDKLVHMGMTFSLSDNSRVKMEVIFLYIPLSGKVFSVEERLRICVAKRYNKSTSTLNLADFHKDPELYNTIYCPLRERKTLLFVLTAAKKLKQPIHTIQLTGNELLSLDPFISLAPFPSLKVLDVGNNKLPNLTSINALDRLALTELVVDGNPLCKDHQDITSYIRAFRSVIPTLKKLDGMLLIEDNDLCWYRNYLISHKSHALVDQFLEHYFTLFDGDNRNQLQGIYHEKAVFSMTARYLPGQSSSSTARLTVYTLESRNLLKMSDCTKSFEQLSCGPEAVLATLCKLPRIEHDPYSFAVDCVQYSDDHAVINVTGVFRELSTMKECPVRWFNRTFILLRVASQQYQIVNEMLHVSNATSSQSKGAFHIPRRKLKATSAGESMSDIDKREMMEIFSQLTEMNLCWAEKCLGNSKWDMRDALQVFTKLLKLNQIPKEAFVPEATRGVQLES